MILGDMSARSTEKQPKIKGLVKRCRSFKDDLMTRLARNKSLAKDEARKKRAAGATGVVSKGGWTSGGTSPIPSDPDITDPIVLIAHRLKEAHLTLQFVESLVTKNCVDLLGGSSNVMLDLMGHLLNDVKGLTALSHTSAYKHTVSQLKEAIGEFLTAVDVLVLKERGVDDDTVQKDMHLDKVLDTLQTTRDALAKLKSLLETRDNGNHHYTNSVRHHSTSCTGSPKKAKPFLTSTPMMRQQSRQGASSTSGAGSSSSTGIISPIGAMSSPSPVAGLISPVGGAAVGSTPSTLQGTRILPTSKPQVHGAEKRPPLPPKLKQLWMGKSFDSSTDLPTSAPANSSSSSTPRTMSPSSGVGVAAQLLHNLQGQLLSSATPMDQQNHLTAWLAQSAATTPTSRHHRSFSQHGSGCGGGDPAGSSGRRMMNSSRFETTVDSSSSPWTESSIYVSSSTTTHSCTSSSRSSSRNQQFTNTPIATSSNPSLYAPRHTSHQHPKHRTHSDSYPPQDEEHEGEEEEDVMHSISGSLGQLLRRQCAASAAKNDSVSQMSISLESSLDNLLLVDSSSVQSGLSPGPGSSSGGNRVSVSSSSGLGGHLSAQGLVNSDRDDVFGEGQDEDDEDVDDLAPPPKLPEKVNRAQFVLLARNGNGGGVRNGAASVGANYGGGGGDRCPSPYENVDATDHVTWHGEGVPSSLRDAFHRQHHSRNAMSYSESRSTLVGGGAAGGSGDDDDGRPPLPPKKKHSLIAAYVEFLHNFESYSQQQQQHHSHFHNHLNAIHHQHLASVASGVDNTNLEQRRRASAFRAERSATLANPGALAAAAGNSIGGRSEGMFSHRQDLTTSTSNYDHQRLSEGEEMTSPTTTSIWAGEGIRRRLSAGYDDDDDNGDEGASGGVPPPALPPKQRYSQLPQRQQERHESRQLFGGAGGGSEEEEASSPGSRVASPIVSPGYGMDGDEGLGQELAGSGPTSPVGSGLASPSKNSTSPRQATVMTAEEAVIMANGDLYIIDATPSLVQNESSSSSSRHHSSSSSRSGLGEGPAIKGGEPHLLIVYAASPDLKDVRFREVFLLTYRTFVRPLDVVNLLWCRYQYFHQGRTDRISLLHARATLDLWVDVVNSLTPMDLEEGMVSILRERIYHLVATGEIQSALKARKGLIQKYSIRVKLLCPRATPASLAVTAEPKSLLSFSATCIAQQMTLLDAELFRQLEPAELLLWAREQSEDFCPALNNFTEHFNKVSYWSRSKVLLCCNSRERNRTMKKMIEVMRKLREFNNFNSLLAVLAALDSAPIRRLGFSRRLTEALKPHAALTDSSGSFRTYRHALGESKPPCIPYIGLVLQDLTFVHIGNVDLLPDGKVNWVKRWQQWVVLEPVRRFHACNYGFVRNDPLLNFLNNFNESLNDDELWQVSESIKPRSKNY